MEWHAETITTILRGYDTAGGYERRDKPAVVATVVWPRDGVAVIKAMRGSLGDTAAKRRQARESLKKKLIELGATRVEIERHGHTVTTSQ